MIARLRNRGENRADQIRSDIDGLAALGYADIARLLGAVDRTLNYAQVELLSRTGLTRSELDVFRLLADGLIPKEIAARSGRSVYTVRVHIANVIAKLGCHGRAEAIRTAQRMGLI
jgi:DNA-binding CsgD family transcriptional regulator